MDFQQSDEQVLLSGTVEKFTQARYGGGQREAYLKEQCGFDPDGWRIMAETGLFALPFSEDRGGLGGKLGDFITVMRPLGRSLAVEPYLAGPVLAGSLIDRIGDEAQAGRWIPRIVDGSAHIALAHTEKSARFRLDHVDARFRGEGEAAAISGKKTFVMGAGAAQAFIVSAIPADWSEDGAARAQAIRFFIVGADSDGITRRIYRLTDGSVACELDLSNAAAVRLGGKYGDLEAVAARVRVAACADMLGVMEMLFDATLDYVKTRKQFGQPIGQFQVIQHRLADLYAALEFSRSHVHRMAGADIEQEEDRRMIAGSKSFISQAAMTLAEEAVQLHGGMGVTSELPIGDGLKRIMVLSNLFGDAAAELARYVSSVEDRENQPSRAPASASADAAQRSAFSTNRR